jgi:hypothetical protein
MVNLTTTSMAMRVDHTTTTAKAVACPCGSQGSTRICLREMIPRGAHSDWKMLMEALKLIEADIGGGYDEYGAVDEDDSPLLKIVLLSKNIHYPQTEY